MQLTGFNMAEINIKKAQFKLIEHRDLGERSNLSILQVARLMDKLKNVKENVKNKHQFSLN